MEEGNANIRNAIMKEICYEFLNRNHLVSDDLYVMVTSLQVFGTATKKTHFCRG